MKKEKYIKFMEKNGYKKTNDVNCDVDIYDLEERNYLKFKFVGKKK